MKYSEVSKIIKIIGMIGVKFLEVISGNPVRETTLAPEEVARTATTSRSIANFLLSADVRFCSAAQLGTGGFNSPSLVQCTAG
jgi:hypothetical protein